MDAGMGKLIDKGKISISYQYSAILTTIMALVALIILYKLKLRRKSS